MEPFERRATVAGCGAGPFSQFCGTLSGVPPSLAEFWTRIYTGVTEVFEPITTQTASPVPTTSDHLDSSNLNPDQTSSTSPNSPTASTTRASNPKPQPTPPPTSSQDPSSERGPSITSGEGTLTTATKSNGTGQLSRSGGAHGTAATASSVATAGQHSDGAVIAAAVLGVIIAFIAIAVGIWLLRRRRRQRIAISNLEVYVRSPETVEVEVQSIHDARYQKNPGYYLYSEAHSLPYDGSKASPRVSLPVSANTSYTISSVEDEKFNFRIHPSL